MDTSSSALLTSGPEWSHGCEHCSHGIVIAPEPSGACEFYLERIVQMRAGDIVFCECRAGLAYHAALRNRQQERIEEARKDPRMAEQAQRLTHPDIEIAAWRLRGKADAGIPSMHFEGAP